MKLSYKLKNSLRIPAGLVLLIAAASQALAQTFAPPTVLPSQNENIGGAGGACIGMADMIRTGNIHLWNIPCFVKYITQTLIALGGSIAVLYVMIGGYKMIVLPEEEKKQAKDTIFHALVGLAVTLMAWVLVDLAVRFATE